MSRADALAALAAASITVGCFLTSLALGCIVLGLCLLVAALGVKDK